MQKWYSIFPKNPWMSIYAWVIFCLLPFFFIFRSWSAVGISVGIGLLALFFISYFYSFKSKSGLVYMWISFEIVINVIMTLLFGYVYLSIFTAFFIGNIRSTVGFFIMYGLHIAFTIGAIVAGFFIEINLFLPQVHFIIITVIGVTLLPFNLYNRSKREKLEDQLEFANDRISELILLEERERIARDLHDTLGQKLSMIGLKSDLARRLISKNPEEAEKELADIRQTASMALKEVRELVADMRTTKLSDEVMRIRQILSAAEIELKIEGEPNVENIPSNVENVLSMCLKEAVTNVVKHSDASVCEVMLKQTADEVSIVVRDNGKGIQAKASSVGAGLKGMRERLEFVNGTLTIEEAGGTVLSIRMPIAITHQVEE
ncbi:sensor histidine kinase [Sporosarcina highlanderae]|uniref:histidine kinase n=1 Tax=Sporosarcina highlanderae TaxID=3035916 RepID=A0ABT8JQE0_9BACL|nr:sensor histidine kinase [Sporosarcina highlanderae]MDN4606632.1 sensor histidine kinase [Sporosarcina highlanderae]